MDWVMFALVVVALVVAIRGSSGAKARLERVESGLRVRESQIQSAREDLESELNVLRRQLAQVAKGKRVGESMILGGRLYDDVDASEAHRIFTEEEGTLVLDVRTPEEYASGHVKGALHIPVEQIESRWEEIPRDAPNVVVHCAAGGRSAAACGFLSSQKGYTNLRNVAGPLVGAWPGEIVLEQRKT